MKFRPARPLNSRILTSCILPSLMHSARRSRGIFTRAATLAIGLCFTASLVSAQSVPLATPRATPAPLGSFVSDSAIPTLISPSEFRSEYFVLNKDFSLLTHSSIDSSLNGTCAAPSGFDASSSTPRTFLNDTQNAYFTGPAFRKRRCGRKRIFLCQYGALPTYKRGRRSLAALPHTPLPRTTDTTPSCMC